MPEAADAILDTPRLRLRFLRPSDVGVLAAMWTDAAATRYVGGPRDAEAVADSIARDAREPRRHALDLWTVERRDDGTVLGQAGFLPKTIDGAEYPELNYFLLPDHWGRGFAAEIAGALVDRLAPRLGLADIVAVIHPGNDASIRVAEKAGLAYWRTVLRPDGETKSVYRLTRGPDGPGETAGRRRSA